MILLPTVENLSLAADVLRGGGVIAIPTETVYGLAARITDRVALETIFRIKGRPSDNPLIVHVSSIEQARGLVSALAHDSLERVAGLFWPGPLTLVFPAADTVSTIITAGLSTVAVRMPQHPIARSIIDECGSPLAAPSANKSGRPSPTTAQHVEADLGPEVRIIDGGPCRVGLESTVVRVMSDKLIVLRPGIITMQELRDRTGLPVDHAGTAEDLNGSPGTRYRHYAPNAHVVLTYSISEAFNFLAGGDARAMLLARPELHAEFQGQIVGSLTEHDLYAELRRADDLHVERIVVLCDGTVQCHEALMNRLRKASQDGNEQDSGT
ncbi:MAG TPA: L-threonylcarbamoyladenylate synthase [Candidatus Didemnitutus sp.]|nr:L-threonylcarbamoyladenylate synthase [Candidatus Didemnitutus sp.]